MIAEALGDADNLAVYHLTSGSTGTPKGVMLARTATHLVDWTRHTFSSDDIARVAATTSLSFDPSIFEIFVPLCLGGAVVIKANALEPYQMMRTQRCFSAHPRFCHNLQARAST